MKGQQVASSHVEDMHRIGGNSVENLRLKPREAALDPPGISLLQASSPGEAARQMREAFPAANALHDAAQVIASTTVDKIRQAGFDVLPNPTQEVAPALSSHPSRRCRGLYGRQLASALGRFSRNVRTYIMSSQCVALIMHERQVVATAHVAEQQGQFIGRIDCSSMPLPLQRLFTEYEEIVSTQVFSLLDEVEDHIAHLQLVGVFEDGHEAALTDVQIYPSTKTVSFQVVQGTVSHPTTPNKRLQSDGE